VTVLGANEIGLNAAAFAAQQGRKVTVVTGGKAAGYDMNPILAAHTIQLLQRADVTFADSLQENGDVVLWAPDWVADESEASIPGIDLISVGARAVGGRLYQATQTGFWAGSRV
jgi:hypothetical protein